MSGAIDAHVHFWALEALEHEWLTPAAGVLYADHLPADLEPHLAPAGIDGVVVVQSADSAEETSFLLDLAERTPWIAAVVGWVPLTDPHACAAALERWRSPPAGRWLRGVRHLVHTEADPGWLAQPEVLESVAVLAEHDLALDVPAEFPLHLEHVSALAAAAPGLRIVVDHLAKPPVAAGAVAPWADAFRAATEPPGVFAKLSGLNTAAAPGWSADDLVPYVDVALERLGPDRILFGTDWPVLLANGTHRDVVDATARVLAGLAPSERERVMRGTAAEVYRIEPGGTP